MAGIILLIFYIGYRDEDMNLINSAMFWSFVFIAAKYFDWVWKLLPKSMFFIIGGVLLIALAFVLESKRRQLNARFG